MLPRHLDGIVTPNWLAAMSKETNRLQVMPWLPYGTFFPLAFRARPCSVVMDASVDVVFTPHLAASCGPEAKFVICVRDHISAIQSAVNFILFQIARWNHSPSLRRFICSMQDPSIYSHGSGLSDYVDLWKISFTHSVSVIETTLKMEKQAESIGIVPFFRAMRMCPESDAAKKSFLFHIVARLIAQYSMAYHISHFADAVSRDRILVVENAI
ncbi:hypothetical protein AURANDRAFT_68558 [Aureococcus anophagefferens]|nr:hypothetical protein AURANDRAFT_68558 [Aureococcus anophagefferens]EGB02797.1 hypothetical protein AURANDRAFT_68558 [Aureococcus anophagefferens]|eukprot:XP_009042503.1 hypothetical protein AURANDRAFT_68558 [Aureococcus anophagefferens]